MATIAEAYRIVLQLLDAGRRSDAARVCISILEAEPESALAANLLGVLYEEAGQKDRAWSLFRRAVSCQPQVSAFQSNVANVLSQNERFATADTAYRHAAMLEPEAADPRANRAPTLRALGRPADAAESCRGALVLDPSHANALHNFSDALLALGELEPAARWAGRAVAVRPGADALSLRGAALTALHRWEEAESSLRAALRLSPRAADAWQNLGALLAKAGRDADALAAFAEAAAAGPTTSFDSQHATALLALGRAGEAASAFDRALAARPEDAGLRWNRAFARLLGGDWTRGWEDFEARRLDDRAAPPWRPFPQPVWSGEDPAGRTILLYAEQGFGDTIQMLRYVPLVAARGARVVLEVQPALRGLAAGVEGVAVLVARGEPLPPFDLECPLMSLPRVFATTPDHVPGVVPYLRPDPERLARWRAELGEGGGPAVGPRVGLVWAGNPRFPGDRLRSPRLAALRPLLDVPGVRFFGLQMGEGRADLERVAMPAGFTDLGPRIGDFVDTAAIIANLDLVISSCTAPAHLAGALGVPLWLALPRAPDWRWLLDREDSPWYPTARLFRQGRVGDWSDVAERMRAALAALTRTV
ncbi:tetratricopeptide repeat protein [Azospirillum sp. RWY-5-1]|uniref:Tetratricopeptide repeat protein n=1 Tax=Azospirillum oleiclasticum TaxID=2735135 RepID=A0ABX2TET7_9PROT|nr:tetratricopeptide repeat protein [Azospirillum oleiclasticum]NYZ14045.1 tetratricopeptide repeat protein [Azospirillum oleiclasticum]NYZ21529.1 tetratricopeptide repeat protein [Azospirillum oleiclasticum]